MILTIGICAVLTAAVVSQIGAYMLFPGSPDWVLTEGIDPMISTMPMVLKVSIAGSMALALGTLLAMVVDLLPNDQKRQVERNMKIARESLMYNQSRLTGSPQYPWSNNLKTKAKKRFNSSGVFHLPIASRTA